MMQTQKNKWIWLALLVTIGLSWEALQHQPASISQPKDISQPTRVLPTTQAARIGMAAHAPNAQALTLTPRAEFVSQYNLFATPFVPPPPPSKKTAYVRPPAPQAPPLPFQYIGRIKIGENDGVLLNVEGEVTPIKQGDSLQGGQYQVQAINAKQVQFLYTPLKEVQILNLP